jgi:hypothetical protein
LGRRTFSPAAYAYNSLISIVTISGLLIYNLRKQPIVKK